MDRQKLQKICTEVWELSRGALSVKYPFFRAALYSFTFQASDNTQKPGCDGSTIFYSPIGLIQSYRRDPEAPGRMLLHILLHILYLHPLLQLAHSQKNDGHDPHSTGGFPIHSGNVPSDPLWDLACDLAVYRMLRHSAQERDACKIYAALCGDLSDHHFFREESARTDRFAVSERRPAYTFDGEPAESLALDDHRFWRRADPQLLLPHVCQMWDRIQKDRGVGFGGSGSTVGNSAGNQSEQMTVRANRAMRLRRYLKKFAVSREEIRTDTESFDYIPYLYGLERYGNMPLIEHLEYQEVRKLEELVIVIDTSGSCSAETVRRFMEETYAILSSGENFFKRMNLFILQCDFCIQHSAHITCEEDWKAYLEHLTIRGRSGTDFRPAFQYVEELRAKKVLRDLKALLYFTDGDGIYPEKATDYETAFLFLNEKKSHQKAPAWANVFILDGGFYEY